MTSGAEDDEVRGRIVKEVSELHAKHARWHLLSAPVEGLCFQAFCLVVCLGKALPTDPMRRDLRVSDSSNAAILKSLGQVQLNSENTIFGTLIKFRNCGQVSKDSIDALVHAR